MNKTFTFFTLLFFVFKITQAQNGQITGIIRDADSKEPLSGATIKYEKVKGRLSDVTGKFTLSLPAGDHELTVSYIGYKTDKRPVSIKAGATLELEILLKPSALQMEQVVTVSQYGKNAATETVSTDVITKTQIEHTNANDLNDIVAKSPGVLVQDGEISMRGGSAYSYGVGSRVAVFIDGVSAVSSDLGQVQGSMVPVENIKQVEVVKGASSVIYGSGAMNGVINVITGWPTEDEPKTDILTNAGVYGKPPSPLQAWWNTAPPYFGSIDIDHQRRIKNVQMVIGGNISYTSNYLQGANEYRVRGFFKLRYISPKIQGLSFGLNGEMQIERTDLFFISKNVSDSALYAADNSGNPYDRTSIHPWLVYSTLKGHRYKLDIQYMNLFRASGPGTEKADDNFWEIDNQYQYRYKGMLVVTAGIPFQLGVETSNLYPGVNYNFAAGAYTQAEFNYKILSLQGGIRWDVSGVDSALVYTHPIFRSGINVQAGKASWFRASWGQGYRIPTVGEKYIAQPFTSIVYIVPNDTLKEENSWSFEFGFQQGFKIKEWKLFLDASVFWQQYQNFIEYEIGQYSNTYANGRLIFPLVDEFPPGSGQIIGAKPLNIENARIPGYEIDVKSNGKIGPVGVTILAGYTYDFPSKSGTDAADANYSAGQLIKDAFKYNFKSVPNSDTAHLLEYRIRNIIHADIELTYWKMYFGATINFYSDPQVVPAFYSIIATYIMHEPDAVNNFLAAHSKGDFILDLRTGIKINERFGMGFIVKNVTNRFYELRPGLAEPIRNFTIQFRYNF